MYKPVRVLASSTGMQNLQHQAKQYSNESHTIPHRTRSYRNGSNITLWTTYSTKPSSTVTKLYKCPGSERNHTNFRVWNFPPCPIVVAASGICVGAAGVALKCHLKGKSAHHLLTKCRKGDLVVKCHLKAKCAHPWHAERRKGDLVDRCHPSAKSGHPWLAERRKGDLVVKCRVVSERRPGRQVSFEIKERPSLARRRRVVNFGVTP